MPLDSLKKTWIKLGMQKNHATQTQGKKIPLTSYFEIYFEISHKSIFEATSCIVDTNPFVSDTDLPETIKFW